MYRKILFLLLLCGFACLSLDAQKPLRKPHKPTQSSKPTTNAGKDNSAGRPSKPTSATPSKQPAKSNVTVTPQKQQAQQLVEPTQSVPSTQEPHQKQQTQQLVEPAQSALPAPEPKYVLTATGSISGHDYVDLGLSVKWATCNVGALSPSDYGDYYAWGETSPKSEYTEENSVTFKKKTKENIAGNSRYDAARANWGGKWRMPTVFEIGELSTKCKFRWITYNDNKGLLVIGPNGKSIFLPAAGWRYGSSRSVVGETGFCYYWTSTSFQFSKYSSENATLLHFDDSADCDCYSQTRSYGYPVRPVSE